MVTLEIGQTVNVYEDPVTCNKFEGKAKLLVPYHYNDTDNLSTWLVRFLDDGSRAVRKINSTTALKEN
jgi:hypothetical protein